MTQAPDDKRCEELAAFYAVTHDHETAAALRELVTAREKASAFDRLVNGNLADDVEKSIGYSLPQQAYDRVAANIIARAKEGK